MEFLTTNPPIGVGIKIKRDSYEEIRNAMLDELAKAKGLTADDLFSILHERFTDKFGDHTGWYLYHVKLDLEAGSEIRIQQVRNKRTRRSVIHLNKKKVR